MKVKRARTWARGVFFGWWIVAGAIGLQALLASLLLQSYSVYVLFLREEFGWSKTALAVGFSILQAGGGLIGPLQGWLLERFGPRNVMRVGMLLFAFGFMMLSQISSLAGFYLAFVPIAIGVSLGGFLSFTTAVVYWFERKRSTALAFVQMGVSIGGLAVPVVAWSLASYGWRNTAFMSGLLILAVGLPLTQLMRSKPEDYGLLPDGRAQTGPTRTAGPAPSPAAPKQSPARHDFTLWEAMRTRAFWFISFGHALALVVVAAVTVHLVVHLNEGLGYSVQVAALMVTLMTSFTFVGQLLGGFLGDRFNKRIIATVAMFGHASALLALAYAPSPFWVVFFAVVHGIAWGARGPLMQAVRADYFGRRYFATIMGTSSLIVMLGMVAGPLIAGYMADRFGNYQLGFTILAGLAAFGSIFFILAKEPSVPS
jgi:MFS family permease